MNDIDDRLTDLLARSADAVEVRSDLDAVTADDGRRSPVVDLGRRPRDTRRLLTLAAAVLAVLGLAAVAVVASQADGTKERAQAPAASGRFPVFGHLPAELAGEHVEANDGEGTNQDVLGGSFRPDTPMVRAALGRVSDDGSILDIIQLAVGAEDAEARPGPQPAQVEDLGGGYRLATDDARLEVHGPGTVVEVYGTPNAEALMRSIAGTALTATVGPDGAPVLTLGDLPDGYTVIAPPTAPEPEQAEIAVPTSPPCDAPSRSTCDVRPATVVVETGVGAPGLAIMGGGPATPVDVAGSPGLMTSSWTRQTFTRIAWTAPSGVTLSLVAEYDADEALAIARGIELVDEDTWRSTYPEWPEGEVAPTTEAATDESTVTTVPAEGPDTSVPDTSIPDTSVPDTPADHPLVGRPAPAVEGTALGPVPYEPPQDAGQWTIVSFMASWCTTCVDMLDDLDAVHRPLHAEGRASVVSVFVDDTVEAARTVVDENEIVWQALVARPSDVEPWGVEGWPTTVFVDPDGIVQQVLVGSAPAELIEEILADLGG